MNFTASDIMLGVVTEIIVATSIIAGIGLVGFLFLRRQEQRLLKKVLSAVENARFNMSMLDHQSLNVMPGTLLLEYPDNITIQYGEFILAHAKQVLYTVAINGNGLYGTCIKYRALDGEIFWPKFSEYEKNLCQNILRKLTQKLPAT